MNDSTGDKKAPPFIEYLYKLAEKDDRGTLADLRKGFSKATEMRAWPHIGRFCRLNDDRQRTVFQTVGAAFALHPEPLDKQYENMGTVMRKIAISGGLDNLPTFESRFRRFLSCTTSEEVCERIQGVIGAAKSNGISVPYESLYWDLLRWDENGDKIKVRWAAQFWQVPEELNVSDSDDNE